MSNRKETAAFSDEFLKQQNKLEIRIAEEVLRLRMGKHGYDSSATGFRSVPTPSTLTSTTSP